MPRAGAAPPSAPLQTQGLRGTGARRRRRGSPALPVAPASIADPRALIGLGAATTRGGVPCRPPLPPRHTLRARQTGKGRREVAPPRTGQPADGAWRRASATQPGPAWPSGPRFYRLARAGWGRVAGEEAGAGREPQRHPRGSRGPDGGARSLATAALRPAGQDTAGLRRSREALSPQGISHNHQSTAGD